MFSLSKIDDSICMSFLYSSLNKKSEKFSRKKKYKIKTKTILDQLWRTIDRIFCGNWQTPILMAKHTKERSACMHRKVVCAACKEFP
jgi:hypothetical protein